MTANHTDQARDFVSYWRERALRAKAIHDESKPFDQWHENAATTR